MKMDKNRFETQKEMVYLDYTNRHDSPQIYFTVDDLKWLIEQAEKVERLEEYIDHLEHERNLLYGRLKMISDLTNKEIK
jgi:hypothetical protein